MSVLVILELGDHGELPPVPMPSAMPGFRLYGGSLLVADMG